MLLSLPFFRAAPTPELLVRRLEDLPPAPKVLHSLQRLMGDPETTIEKLAELVKLEPGLSARVVRMANSTHFGRGAQVETIVEAIQRVGIVGVQELVTFAVASQLVGRPLAAYRLDAQSLWSRAVACAIAASSLAEHSDVERSDAYTAGLMHGLGLLVIDRYAAKERKQRVFPSAGYPHDFAPAEREWLGFSHAEAGAALLELWGFSAAVTEAVRQQLTPEQSVPEHRQLSMILATARWARSLFCVPEELIPELPPPLWMDEAGVEIGDFGWWLSKVRIRYQIACDELRLS
ncbi:MAG TPA: HDOD domain-containing protein [Opitutus sp.]|nr:HDOD domain-containing protein [Opitutus sp.]